MFFPKNFPKVGFSEKFSHGASPPFEDDDEKTSELRFDLSAEIPLCTDAVGVVVGVVLVVFPKKFLRDLFQKIFAWGVSS